MKHDAKTLPVFEDGIFTPYIVGFIHYKRSNGLKYEDSAQYVLRTICRRLNQYPIDCPELTKEMVDDLVNKRPEEKYSTQSRRVTYLREFARYLNRHSVTAYVYPEQSRHREETAFIRKRQIKGHLSK